MTKEEKSARKFIMYLNDRIHGRAYMNLEAFCKAAENFVTGFYRIGAVEWPVCDYHRTEAAMKAKDNPKYNFYNYYISILFGDYDFKPIW